MIFNKSVLVKRSITSHGYALVKATGHPRAFSNGYVYEHIFIAELALGHHLPPKAQVHHVNGNKLDNQHSNLVICEDNAYHKLLHHRQRAYKAIGDVNGVQCKICKKWGVAGEDGMRLEKSKRGCRFMAYHKPCHALYQKERRSCQTSCF